MQQGFNPQILSEDVQKYINANLQTDLHSLLLKKSPFGDVTMSEIVQQIKGRNVAARKFPFLLQDGIVFPPNLNLEQASSQATAEFKSQDLRGNAFLDLTAGFGVDAYFLSQNFDEVTLVEQNDVLSETVKHNWQVLGRKANFCKESLESFLARNSGPFDLVYLDPARRDQDKNKKFLLGDLSPNLLEIHDKLLQISRRIIIKLSPLIDISYLISVLTHITKIQIIAVRNDVKELLVFISSDAGKKDVEISCVNLESDEAGFNFNFAEEKSAVPVYSEPLAYLFIPNNSVLKSGAFSLISEKFGLRKLHPNSHFYTSDSPVTDFPGRMLKVERIDSKQIKKGEKFNIISKNYPLSPDEIKKKYKISDGGENYLIFTQTINGKVILKSSE